ncbi:alpha/beta-hydrolase [Violaceomyces palustris]|uniref:Alpha/beta-hydrolase n=1 Tax=Violaceomyces palustris TaxID=1673888 RepID=A0ACD0P2Y1_9BASI|nr:alpha/beta-hydrolase [Violaceomyces palustris]
MTEVDPKVLAAVRAAKVPRPQFWRPLVRILVFQIYFIPTSLIHIPLVLLRCLVPSLRPDRRLDFQTSVSILVVKRAMRNMIRFHFQPIAPRENGWRDGDGFLATLLSVLNFSGPGGYVSHPQLPLKIKANQATRSPDKVWFDAPPLEALTGILSVRTQDRKARVSSKTYTGPPLVDPGWAKCRTRAFWFMHRSGLLPPLPVKLGGGDRERDRPVVLYFHGGAGVTFNAADPFMGRTLANNFARTAQVDVFSVDYNLAPYAPFPIPLLQALGAYIYLVRDLGYLPHQVFVGGDSFGAWLTLQLERYLRLEYDIRNLSEDLERSSNRIEPRTSGIPGLILLSAFIAADGDHFASRARNVGTDIISLDYADWGAKAQLLHKDLEKGRVPIGNDDVWLTHSNRSREELEKTPPCYLANGGGETLLDEGLHFADLLRNAKGVDAPLDSAVEVRTDVVPNQPHDFFTLQTSIRQSKAVYARIGEWIRKVETLSGYSVKN